MEKTELRLTNLVEYPGWNKDGTPAYFGIRDLFWDDDKVALSDGFIHLPSTKLEYLKPILLTEEWFLKLGFDKCEGQYGVYFKSPHDKQVRIYFYDEKWCIGYVSDHPRGFSTIGSFIHVHKLQNFHYEFVGTELEIIGNKTK